MELKNRGVKEVSYICDDDSGVLAVEMTDHAMEMAAWNDLWCEKRLKLYHSFYEEVIEAVFSSSDDILLDEVSVEQEINASLAYRDIRKVLSSKDISSFSKHELDIYFALQAVTGNVMYYDDDIAVETVRLTEYWYGGHENILDTLENLNFNDINISDCSGYTALDEILSQLSDWCVEDYFFYGYGLSWDTIDL